MSNPVIVKKLQELINLYGWDQVMNSFPPKKVLNEVDRVQDTHLLDHRFKADQFNNKDDNSGLAATPIINDRPPDDAAPSIASRDQNNINRNKNKLEALIS